MRITPKTDEELNILPFPEGIYVFKVNTSIERISSKGNPMIELSLDVFNVSS
jgi:hypothetical protein